MSDATLDAFGQAWPPFALVAGLLLIGAVVEADGRFAAIGARIERIGGGPVVLLGALLGLEALVTAVLNLDTAVVFLTPVILHAARQRGCDERPFLYGALFMANGASLVLPGSNLTNLIVLAHEPLSGADVRSCTGASLARGGRPDHRLPHRRLPTAGGGPGDACPTLERPGLASGSPRRRRRRRTRRRGERARQQPPCSFTSRGAEAAPIRCRC